MVHERVSYLAVLGALVGALSSQAACQPAVPDNPTWTEDVRPILMANCVRCHTDPPIGEAPGYLRLDRYDDWPTDDGGTVIGAAALAMSIANRVGNADNPMPPIIGPLNSRQQEILQLWADNGAPYGDPLDGNVAPEITVNAPEIDQAARIATMTYELRDADGDYTLGLLHATGPQDVVTVTAALHSGPGVVTWDFSEVPEGSYTLSAELDDGNHQDRFSVDLGITIDVPAPPLP